MTSTYVSREEIQEKNVRWLVSHELFSTKYKHSQHEIWGPKFTFLDTTWQLEMCLKTYANYFGSTSIQLVSDFNCDFEHRLDVTTMVPVWVKVVWSGLVSLTVLWMSIHASWICLSVFVVVFFLARWLHCLMKRTAPEDGLDGFLDDLIMIICCLGEGCIFYWGVIWITTSWNHWCGNMLSRTLGLIVAIITGFIQASNLGCSCVSRFKPFVNKAKWRWRVYLWHTWYLRMTASPEHEIRLRIRVRSCKTTGVFPRKNVYTCENIVRSIVNNEDCTDVTLRTMEGDEIKAQSTFLTYHSKVFRKMLSPGNFNEGINGLVELPDVGSEHVRALLDFCYYGHISKDQVCEMFKLADKYIIDALREGCFEIMKSEKDSATVISYIQTLRWFQNDMDCKETAFELLTLIRSTDVKTAFVRETMSTWSNLPSIPMGVQPL